MGILKWRKHSHRLTRLRSAVGERKQWSGDGETAGTESERNAAAEPQTEARRCFGQSIAARDERAVLRRGTGVVERETGPTVSQCSEAKRTLVTAVR